jgi:DNA mismatch endonuclease, patch repair protein
MSDKFSPATRSYIMSKIHSSNTKPEILVRSFLHQNGFRFRKNVKSLPGTPDIVISKLRTIIFVNGCFWHGHVNCKEFRPSKTRTNYWEAKISRNIIRDKESIEKLQHMGWNVLVLWECQLTPPKKRKATLNTLLDILYNFFLDSIRK